MGTTRMGKDPKTSVVNEIGACHDVNNLFIVDRVFSLLREPLILVSTMQALSLYIADNIKKNLPNLLL